MLCSDALLALWYTFIMENRRRPHLRARSWDYSDPAQYFVTVCTHKKRPMLAVIPNDHLSDPEGCDVQLTPIGLICQEVLAEPLEALPTYSIAKRVIMPNHIHLIVVNEGERERKSLSHLMARVKGKVTRECRREGILAQDEPLWQRGFYDHIIRDEEDRQRIVEYIANNPMKWHLDRFHTGT